MKAFFALLFFLFTVQAEATTYYVAKTGSGSACTIGAPCLTISTGLTKLASGDTLEIGAGTYAEQINRSQVPSGTSWPTATTIQPAAGATVIITGNGSSPLSFTSPGAGIIKQYIIFRGTGTNNLIFDPGSADTVNAVAIGGAGNGGTTQFIRLDGVTVRNVANSSAIFLGDDTSQHLEVINSIIHDWTSSGTSPQNHGIYVGGGNNLIENNLIYNGQGYGIHAYNSGGASIVSNNRITRNIIHDVCTDPGGCNGIVQGYGTNNEISNNLIYNIVNGGNGSGIGLGTNSTAAIVYGNTVYNTDYWGINTYGSTGATITNNIFSTVNTGGGNAAFSGDGSHTYDNNLCSTAGTNCEFVESAATTFVTPGSNFTLKAGSAALNAGGTTPTGIPYNVDILGIVRPQGAAYDLGAYETVSGIVPNVVITVPTSSATYATSSPAIGVSGSSTQSGGSVTWSCDRCTPSSGTATGTVSWSLPTLTLKAGINVLTVTGTTALGDSAQDTLIITYAPTFPGNSLVAAYGFDEGSGTATADASGNTNTATLSNTPTWVAGRYGNALQFNGTSQSVIAPDRNWLDTTQSFSITLWVKPTAVVTDYRGLVIKNGGAIGNPYALYGSVLGECGDGGIAGYSTVNGASGPLAVACSSTPLQQSSWTHLAVTWNGSIMTLYKNGVSVATKTQTGYSEPTTGTLQIGATEYGEYFNGVIDELRVYNFAVPLTGGANTVFGAGCNATDAANVKTASIIGDANCPIIPLAPPITFKVGASTTLKLGASSTTKIGSVPQ